MGIKLTYVELGTDPEAFVSKDGLIVGSERVIPEAGLLTWKDGPKVVRDGVQIELNVRASNRRETLGEDITAALIALKKTLRETGFSVSFDPVVTISKLELDALSEKSRQFGCARSYNAYGLLGPSADPRTYLYRSAGGHIHLGLFPPIFDRNLFTEIEAKDETGADVLERLYSVDKRRELPFLLDTIVGTVGVLLDRDPLASERRKNYGKAGEFRLPNHGLEYRTLSNFWLRSYQLFSLVMGLSKLAVGILHTSLTSGEDLAEELLDAVNLGKVMVSIQNNDYVLAHETWDIVREFIRKHGALLGDDAALNPGLLDKFELFLKIVEGEGLSKFFPDNPLTAWTLSKHQSWESFLRYRV